MSDSPVQATAQSTKSGGQTGRIISITDIGGNVVLGQPRPGEGASTKSSRPKLSHGTSNYINININININI